MTDMAHSASHSSGHSFVFEIRSGQLEAKAALLACTLRQNLHSCNRIVAAVMAPESHWGTIRPSTRALLERLEVEMVSVTNEIDPAYPRGNRINAMGTIKGPAIFLDSEAMMIRPFITHHSLLGADASLEVADSDTFTQGRGSWSRVYKKFGLPLPEYKTPETPTNPRMRPYYKTGFVRVKDGAEFSRAWLDTAKQINTDPAILNKRPWLDRIALPVALARLGWSIAEISASLNFPIYLEEEAEPLPYIVDYHFPKVVWENLRLRQNASFYLEMYPELKSTLADDPGWAVFFGGTAPT